MLTGDRSNQHSRVGDRGLNVCSDRDRIRNRNAWQQPDVFSTVLHLPDEGGISRPNGDVLFGFFGQQDPAGRCHCAAAKNRNFSGHKNPITMSDALPLGHGVRTSGRIRRSRCCHGNIHHGSLTGMSQAPELDVLLQVRMSPGSCSERDSNARSNREERNAIRRTTNGRQ